jgi:tryptophanyl-tRNA synthetase
MGMLERAHAFKAARDKGEDVDHGLFSYPVLMAADILLYNADVVPVGQDQKQHLEMTRDMAQRFNAAYDTEALVLPEPYILKDVATVPGTDGQKMSKSYGNVIEMFAPKKQLEKSVMSIVTDSTPVEAPKDPSGALFQLYNLFASEAEQAEMADVARAGGTGYGDIKKALLERVLDFFGPMRERRERYEAHPDEVEAILRRGAERARAIALPVLERCREAVGIGQPG